MAGSMVFFVSAIPAFADDAHKFQGDYEFRTSCATCHGLDAKGNGPMAGAMKIMPTDLTQLTKKNGGVFPYERVFSIIEGRVTADAHGRDMPVWGERYNLKVKAAVVRARIFELVAYVKSVQE